MKKIFIILFIVLVCLLAYIYTSFTPAPWRLFYYPSGLNIGRMEIYPTFYTLTGCKKKGNKLVMKDVATNQEADYLCASKCKSVWFADNARPEFCEKNVIAKCYGGKCEFNK